MKNWSYFLWNFNVQMSIYFAVSGVFFLLGGDFLEKYYIINHRKDENYWLITNGLFCLFISLNSYEMAYATRKEMLRCNAMGNCILWSLSFYLNVYFLKEFTLFFKIFNLACNFYFLIFTYYILCILKMTEIKLPA